MRNEMICVDCSAERRHGLFLSCLWHNVNYRSTVCMNLKIVVDLVGERSNFMFCFGVVIFLLTFNI